MEHKVEVSETKPNQLPVIQIPLKRIREDEGKTRDADDADEPWICRGRD